MIAPSRCAAWNTVFPGVPSSSTGTYSQDRGGVHGAAQAGAALAGGIAGTHADRIPWGYLDSPGVVKTAAGAGGFYP